MGGDVFAAWDTQQPTQKLLARGQHSPKPIGTKESVECVRFSVLLVTCLDAVEEPCTVSGSLDHSDQ